MDETNQDQHEVRSVKRGRKPKAEIVADSPAQSLALRIWEGQSVDLPVKVRRARISAALEAQGMSMDGVELPDA